jgi:hypothetical protein
MGWIRSRLCCSGIEKTSAIATPGENRITMGLWMNVDFIKVTSQGYQRLLSTSRGSVNSLIPWRTCSSRSDFNDPIFSERSLLFTVFCDAGGVF